MTYNILQTGSDGNCTILNGCIAIDMGVTQKLIAPYARDLKLVLLTHEHGDHFKPATVTYLAKERPALRWGCCEWMAEKLVTAGVKKTQIDVYAPYYHYTYPNVCAVSPVPIPHNVPNCGYRIEADGERALYVTDCGTLEGVSAQNYDLYLVEANHRQAEIEAAVREAREKGEFTYRTRAAENHLSYEQAVSWLTENMGPKSIWVPMHEHKERGEDHECRTGS